MYINMKVHVEKRCSCGMLFGLAFSLPIRRTTNHQLKLEPGVGAMAFSAKRVPGTGGGRRVPPKTGRVCIRRSACLSQSGIQ